MNPPVWLFLTYVLSGAGAGNNPVPPTTYTETWCARPPIEIGDSIGLNSEGCYERAISRCTQFGTVFKIGTVTYIWDEQNEW
jgi:hypothetical protein